MEIVIYPKTWSSLVVGDEGCIGPSGKLLCSCETRKHYAAHAWHHSIHAWLLSRSSCSSPSTKELHELNELSDETRIRRHETSPSA